MCGNDSFLVLHLLKKTSEKWKHEIEREVALFLAEEQSNSKEHGKHKECTGKDRERDSSL